MAEAPTNGNVPVRGTKVAVEHCLIERIANAQEAERCANEGSATRRGDTMERMVGLMLLAFAASAFAQQGQMPVQQQESYDQNHRYETGEIGQHPQRQKTGEQPERATDHRTLQSTSAPGSSSKSLQQLAIQRDDLSHFVEAMKAAGLEQEFADGEYTVFAPTNEAFESMDGGVDELMRPENREQLIELLHNHLVPGKLDMEHASRLEQAMTVGGGTLALATDDGRLTVNGAPVDDTGIQSERLIAYSINEVLQPRDGQELEAAPKTESWAASDQTKLELHDEDANED